ncbi:MAG: tRNA 2-thiocytidine(32) synthetase TtcA [Bdellovibrionales bacterium]
MEQTFLKEITDNKNILAWNNQIAPEDVIPQDISPEERYEKLEKKIFRGVGRAIGDFNLIEEGDHLLVGVSGGKDSWTMLHVIHELQKRAPINFTLTAVNLDQGYSGFRQDVIEDYLEMKGIKFYTEHKNIAQIVEEKSSPGSIACSLCSRLRRGSLYGIAEQLGCNKIALGHHLDDFVETLLLNQFFVGRTSSMAVKLLSDDKKNVVIRPLVYVSEKDIIEYTELMKFPIVCCQCPLACGTEAFTDHKRRMVKDMLTSLEEKIPFIKNSLLSSLGNIRPAHMLDKNLWKFE